MFRSMLCLTLQWHLYYSWQTSDSVWCLIHKKIRKWQYHYNNALRKKNCYLIVIHTYSIFFNSDQKERRYFRFDIGHLNIHTTLTAYKSLHLHILYIIFLNRNIRPGAASYSTNEFTLNVWLCIISIKWIFLSGK